MLPGKWTSRITKRLALLCLPYYDATTDEYVSLSTLFLEVALYCQRFVVMMSIFADIITYSLLRRLFTRFGNIAGGFFAPRA